MRRITAFITLTFFFSQAASAEAAWLFQNSHLRAPSAADGAKRGAAPTLDTLRKELSGETFTARDGGEKVLVERTPHSVLNYFYKILGAENVSYNPLEEETDVVLEWNLRDRENPKLRTLLIPKRLTEAKAIARAVILRLSSERLYIPEWHAPNSPIDTLKALYSAWEAEDQAKTASDGGARTVPFGTLSTEQNLLAFFANIVEAIRSHEQNGAFLTLTPFGQEGGKILLVGPRDRSLNNRLSGLVLYAQEAGVPGLMEIPIEGEEGRVGYALLPQDHETLQVFQRLTASDGGGKVVYNFSPGPAMDREMIEALEVHFRESRETGKPSWAEISHVAPDFEALLTETQQNLRDLLAIPKEFEIVFFTSGASYQYWAIPFNFLPEGGHAVYLHTDPVFSKRAIDAARRFERADGKRGLGTKVTVAATSENLKFSYVPNIFNISIPKDASYVYLVQNNTSAGTAWHLLPETQGVPLIIDATSSLLTFPIRQEEWEKISVIFAGTQKNLGIPGMTVAIVRQDLLKEGKARDLTPDPMNYSLQADKTYHTRNTLAVFAMNEILKRVKKQNAGVRSMEANAVNRSRRLYNFLETSRLFRPTVPVLADRSNLNVTFTLLAQELTEEFLAKAEAEGLTALRGHRDVGGIRASLYNGMPYEGVEALVDFMGRFEREFLTHASDGAKKKVAVAEVEKWETLLTSPFPSDREELERFREEVEAADAEFSRIVGEQFRIRWDDTEPFQRTVNDLYGGVQLNKYGRRLRNRLTQVKRRLWATREERQPTARERFLREDRNHLNRLVTGPLPEAEGRLLSLHERLTGAYALLHEAMGEVIRKQWDSLDNAGMRQALMTQFSGFHVQIFGSRLFERIETVDDALREIHQAETLTHQIALSQGKRATPFDGDDASDGGLKWQEPFRILERLGESFLFYKESVGDL